MRVVGIQGAVDLYELHAETATQEWLQRRDAYEKSLDMFEAGEWSKTCQMVYPLLAGQSDNYDIASLDLVARSIECIKNPPDPFDPVLDLKSK